MPCTLSNKGSVMIDTAYPGRLGNNLFQYSFARMQAEDNNQPYCMSLPGYGVLTSIDTNKAPVPAQPFVTVLEREHDPSWIPPPVIEGTNVRYDGYFQRWKFFEGKRDRVRGFFNIPKPYTSEPSTVCIHVRLTDFHTIQTLVKDPQIYGRVIDTVYDSTLVVVTDDPADPYLTYFKDRYSNVTILSGSPREDFTHLLSYDTLITCNSTFSWWAAYLGNSSKIFIPIDFGRGSAAEGLHNLGTGF